MKRVREFQDLVSKYQNIDLKESFLSLHLKVHTVKLGIKELFDKEQIGIKEPFSVTNLPFTS